MEIIAKELQLDVGHPDVHRLFLAIYKSFMEVLNISPCASFCFCQFLNASSYCVDEPKVFIRLDIK